MAEATGWAGGSAAQSAPRPHRLETPRSTASTPANAATGAVRTLLRAEGLALLTGALIAYAHFGAGWGFFAAVFLLPDVAFLAYLAGPRWGAAAYNATHSTLGPWAATALGAATSSPLLLATGLAWGAHVGMDRALGFGLKYAQGFTATHLGPLGKPDPW
jgi:hypothetical protein